MVFWKRYTIKSNHNKDYFICIGNVKTSWCQQTSQWEGNCFIYIQMQKIFSMIVNSAILSHEFRWVSFSSSVLTSHWPFASVWLAQQPSQMFNSCHHNQVRLVFPPQWHQEVSCPFVHSTLPCCVHTEREEKVRRLKRTSLISLWWMLLKEKCECLCQSITSLLNSCMLLTDCRHPELQESSSPDGNLKFHHDLLVLQQNAQLRWPI